jgi:hypothetical protein
MLALTVSVFAAKVTATIAMHKPISMNILIILLKADPSNLELISLAFPNAKASLPSYDGAVYFNYFNYS